MSMSKRRYNQVVILEGYNGEFNRIKEEECMKEQNIRNATSEQSFQLHLQCHTECFGSELLLYKLKIPSRLHQHHPLQL